MKGKFLKLFHFEIFLNMLIYMTYTYTLVETYLIFSETWISINLKWKYNQFIVSSKTRQRDLLKSKQENIHEMK